MQIEWSLKTKTKKSCFWKEKITGDDSKKKKTKWLKEIQVLIKVYQ